MNGSDVIAEVRRLLLSSQREEMNILQGAVLANATSLTFKYDLAGILAGSLINIDLETYRVWSVDPGSKSAVVQPAMSGTTSSAHSDQALVYVNPKLSHAGIFKAMNDELRALSTPMNGLYQMKSYEFTYQAPVLDYDFPDAIDIYDVFMSLPGPEQDWRAMPNWRWKPKADSTAFPSGSALHVPGGLPGRSMQVLYKAGFTPLSATTDDLSTVGGLPIEMHDIISLGVLLRLGPVREIKRNFTESQGDTRRATEVPPSSVANSYSAVRQLRQQRITEEAARLSVKYPTRHR